MVLNDRQNKEVLIFYCLSLNLQSKTG